MNEKWPMWLDDGMTGVTFVPAGEPFFVLERLNSRGEWQVVEEWPVSETDTDRTAPSATSVTKTE